MPLSLRLNSNIQNAERFIWKYRKIITFIGVLMAFSSCMLSMFAADNIFDAGSGVIADLLTNIRSVFCYRIAPLVLVINLIVLAVSKDEKVFSAGIKALITIAVVWIILQFLPAILATLTQLQTAGDGGSQDESWDFSN